MDFHRSRSTGKGKVNKFKLSMLVSAGLLLALPTTLQAQISLDTVLKNCEKKMQVWGLDEKGKAVKVGERIDGYCQGVLEGGFAILVRTGTICVKDKSTSPDFLLSTVLTYQTETKSQNNDAATVLEAAFKRAFSCGR
jgi:hypothetical protein